MTQDSQQDHDDAAKSARIDDSAILDLNFVPEWARREPGSVSYAGGRGKERGDRGRDAWRPDGRRDRPQRRERPQHRRPDAAPSRRGPPRRAPQRPEPVEPAPVRIRFLPEQKTLSAIVRRIRSTRRAYPLDQLAQFVLGNEDACYAKVEPMKGETPPVSLFQCKLCHSIGLDREELVQHLCGAHREDFFTAEEKVEEAPTGSFTSVARCGLTGVLLGPPNHHSYAERLQEIHRSRFPEMSIAAYSSRIETLRDAESVEQWKEQYRRQTVYRLQNQPEDAEPMAAADVDRYLQENVAPKQIVRVKSASLPLDTARAVANASLQVSFAAAWRRANRFPRFLLLALRAAFSHMHLYLFKVGKHHEFVMAARPAPLDPIHTVDTIRETLLFLKEHPGCGRKELVAGLRPDVAADSPEVVQILSPLTWLIEKGHIIEFFDGTLSIPLGTSRAR